MIKMTSVDSKNLKQFVFNAFSAIGLNEKDAGIFTDALMFSELRFHSGQGQGVQRITTYYKRIKNNEVNINSEYEILKESSSLALVDAKNGIGTIQASKCMDIAINKAKTEGIGKVIVKNSTHFGSSSVHAVKATKENCIGIVYTNAGPEMAPWGSKSGGVGTNPWGISCPTGKGFPLILDIALTTAGKGMMRWYEREGIPMPEDWALTKDGEETTNPTEAMNGFLLGIGKYKGYGLSFMTDVLTGVISGGGYGLMPYSDPNKLDVSHSLTAINIEWFMEITEFYKRIDDFVNTLKNLPLRPGFDEILVPGEIENKRVKEKMEIGIPLDNKVIESFNELALNLSIEKLKLN
jgi:LDH2 family malate/lactate/ureidoglycolate dehydrogenase